MSYSRPDSPRTLETYSPPASDIDTDDLLGSDDELDEAARAAKRQRIEKLAESYLQGNPLFILSASLRGPFDKGWVNPWRKTRKSRANVAPTGARSSREVRNTERIIQETDLRHPRYRGGSSDDSRPPQMSASSSPSVTASAKVIAPSLLFRSDQERTVQPGAGNGQSRDVSRSPGKSREVSSHATEGQSFDARETVDWLKKDRNGTNLTRFEPPSSPTTAAASRQSDNRTRRIVSGSVEIQPPKSPSCMRTPKAVSASMNLRADCAADTSPYSTRSAAPVSRQVPAVVMPSPFQRRSSPDHALRPESSHRVVSSSSQLPNFEYRGRRDQLAQSKSSAGDAAKTSPSTRVPKTTRVPKNKSSDVVVAGSPDESSATSADPSAKERGSRIHSSKDLRFANETGGSNFESKYLPAQTEQNTCENLPSAQEMPVPLGVSDRVTSLHSTAMPKVTTEPNTATSNDTQPSTQAALLRAQKSFQDDLESPEHERGTISGPKRRSSRSSNDAPYSENVVPFYELETPSRGALPRSSKKMAKDMIPVMSTQHMIDTATPFIFSTEKKSKVFHSGSSPMTSTKKQKTAHISEASPPSPERSTPSPENGYRTAQSGVDESGPCSTTQRPDYPPIHRSATQATNLPFTLTGSTPATAQDGQGGFQGVESFNLSQAIADAGSWLQQSFDSMREVRDWSQYAGAVASSDAPSSTLNRP